MELSEVVHAAQAAGRQLAARYTPDARPVDRPGLIAAVRANEAAVSGLPDGPSWVVDAVEGNVNHIHGLPEWGVSITGMRDDEPQLAVFHQPVGDLTWTAQRGRGAFRNGRPLRVSAKTDLAAAIVTSGQAEAGQTGTYRRIGDSVTAMLGRALLVRLSVPSTFPLLQVASGQADVFWQFSPSLEGVAAGVLLAAEAGGVVTRIDGSPWHPGSPDILVAAPGVHAAAVDVLKGI
jgi:myo-inositol-1(or 4)-monophosphatase